MNKFHIVLTIFPLLLLTGCNLNKNTSNNKKEEVEEPAVDMTGYIKLEESVFGANVIKYKLNNYLDTCATKVYKTNPNLGYADQGYFNLLSDETFYYFFGTETSISSQEAVHHSLQYVKYFPINGAVIIHNELTCYYDELGLGAITADTFGGDVAFVLGRTGDRVSFSGTFSRIGLNSLAGYEIFATFYLDYVVSPCDLCDASFVYSLWEVTQSTATIEKAQNAFASESGTLLYKVYSELRGCLSYLNALFKGYDQDFVLITKKQHAIR